MIDTLGKRLYWGVWSLQCCKYS